MTRIGDFLTPSAICVGVEAASDGEVIQALGDRLLALGKVHPSYAAAVMARENSMPTGLPLGTFNVAVPHTDVDHVREAALAVATLKRPVPFGSMDDPDQRIPVHVVIAMALTDKNAQIDMLQRIAGLIQNEDALAALVAARDPADVMAAFQRTGG